MSEVFNIKSWEQVIVQSLTELGTTIAGFLPNLVGMLVILGVGWVLARVVKAITGRVLRRTGIDGLAERLGMQEVLHEGGVKLTISSLISSLFFWLLMLTFVLSAVETLGLTAVTHTIDRLIAYLPNIIAAALIVVLGMLLARFVGNLVGSAAAAANMPYARPLGSFARGSMVIMVAILAIEQLGVNAEILLYAVVTVIGAVSLGLGLAFALGSREVVGAILSGYYIRKSLAAGSRVTIDGRDGTLHRVGPVDTVFDTETGSWSIPNASLLSSIIDRRPGQ